MNRLTQSLAEICAQHLLAEKWLLAPSRRVGQQWVEAVARSGQPAVNVHVKTLASLAMDLAADEIAAEQLTRLTPRGGELLIDRVLESLRGGQLRYLDKLEPSAGLTETVYRTIAALRLAGLEQHELDLKLFEASDKGRDLRAILGHYVAQLKAEKLIDDAEVLRRAAARIRDDAAALPDGVLLLAPADLDAIGLERRLIEAFPSDRRLVLPTDDAAADGETATTDLGLLRWLSRAAAAPDAIKDNTVQIRRAVGEVNEVRGVLRQCVAGQLRWDEVELLHADTATYVPLVYETLSALSAGSQTPGEDLPVTFAEGLPCGYSRPGRALRLWLDWMRDDFPQATLVKMLREGLINVPGSDEGGPSFSRLAKLLGRVGIGFGRGRYATQLAATIEGLQRRLAEDGGKSDEELESQQHNTEALQRRLADYRTLEAVCRELVACSPEDLKDSAALLTKARGFVTTQCRSINELDRFAVQKLELEIKDLHEWLERGGGAASVSAFDWLTDLPEEARVLGNGPRPGCIHVAAALSGGHSGRPHTFIVGLDDGRFPGAGLQDPVLLDSERSQLSDELPTAAGRLKDTLRDFTRLLARLRGHVTLSFCTRNVHDDSEMFPSGVILSAFRLISGERDGDPTALAAWVAKNGPPASFAPAAEDECLSAAEWWLWRLCGPTAVRDAAGLVLASFPHLARGLHAAERRASPEFTEFDGRVEQAGDDLDPTQPGHGALSANRLQKIGKCPLMYFFEYGLGLEAPDELEIDSSRWLDPLAFGSLLHEVLEEFMRELLATEQRPDPARDEGRLLAILAERIARYRALHPEPSEQVYLRQRVELERTARMFLHEEARYCQLNDTRPVYLEATLGMKADGHGTLLDSDEPVPVTLGGNRTVRLRGRIDRIDQVGEGAVQTYAVWDYKSGGTWGYDQGDPFQQGRAMQPFLYVTMVAHRLREQIGPQATVSQFGFFFPGVRAAGQRYFWDRDALEAGREVLSHLVDVVGSGAFLATDETKDCGFCDFQGVCGDVTKVAGASKLKLASPDDDLLAPIRALRPRKKKG